MTSNAHPLALPVAFSPDDLDPLTELSLILGKVRAGIQASNGLNTEANGTSAIGGVDQPQQQQQQQLSFKEVQGATDGLKHKLQKAKTQVAALPDMHRTTAEQEEEMRELGRKIEKQRALLERIKDGGIESGAGVANGESMDTT